jgi:hypothetical protein
MADMRERIREQTDLARTYAKDGAFHTAARVLLDLGDEVKAHAIAFDRHMGTKMGAKRK